MSFFDSTYLFFEFSPRKKKDEHKKNRRHPNAAIRISPFCAALELDGCISPGDIPAEYAVYHWLLLLIPFTNNYLFQKMVDISIGKKSYNLSNIFLNTKVGFIMEKNSRPFDGTFVLCPLNK